MTEIKKLTTTEQKRINGEGSPLYYGANGYLSRDKNGHYHYTVTKGPVDARCCF